MGLLDGLVTLDVVDCNGTRTGTVNVLGSAVQVTIGAVSYVKINGKMWPANCVGTPNTPALPTVPGGANTALSAAAQAAMAGALAIASPSPTFVRSTGTCGICIRQRVPLDRYGLVVVHPKRRSTTGTCRGSLTVPREDRVVKDRV